MEASLSSEIKPKTWGQTGDSKSTIKGLSHLALSLSLYSTFLLEGPGHTTSPTLGIIHNCTIPNFTIPEIFLCPGIKLTCTIPKNIPNCIIPEICLCPGIKPYCIIPEICLCPGIKHIQISAIVSCILYELIANILRSLL